MEPHAYITLVARQATRPAASITVISTSAGSETDPASAASSSAISDDFATSKIVRTAVAAGVIVLALTGVVLFFKVCSRRFASALCCSRVLQISYQGEVSLYMR